MLSKLAAFSVAAVITALGVAAGGQVHYTSTMLDVKLKAGWESAKAQEIFEFLREVSEEDALKFFHGAKNISDYESQFVEKNVLTFAQLAIENHYFSPRIEMMKEVERFHRSMYDMHWCHRKKGWWFLVPDAREATCSVKEMNALKEAKVCNKTCAHCAKFGAKEVLYTDLKYDIVINPLPLNTTSEKKRKKAILYWDLKVARSKSIKKFLAEPGINNDYEIVFRHADPDKGKMSKSESSDYGDYLSGYGVEFLIKNTEYKTTAGDGSSGAEDFQLLESGAELSGMLESQ